MEEKNTCGYVGPPLTSLLRICSQSLKIRDYGYVVVFYDDDDDARDTIFGML